MQAKKFEQAYPLMLEQLEQSKLMDEQQGIEMSEKSASFAYKCSVCLGHRNSLKEALNVRDNWIMTYHGVHLCGSSGITRNIN